MTLPTTTTQSSTEDREAKYISIDDLFLDPENPRLPKSVQGSDQSTMLQYIAQSTAIEDLMGAIASNGYFPGEPVVAYKRDDKYIVIEGNRRLTAVKLLNDPHLLSNPRAKLIAICEENDSIKPNEIPVIVCETRDEVLPYLGFRHITGVKEWEPVAKARYMKQLLELTPERDDLRGRFRDVARMIGSRGDAIKRNVDALEVYELIAANNFYSIESLDEESMKFAVLSTALADPRISIFIGITSENGDEITYNEPFINSQCMDEGNVEKLTKWLFERDDEGRTRVPESRAIRELSQVVANEKALAAFIGGSSLAYAYRITEGVDEDFMELLYEAQSSIQRAASLVANVKYREDGVECARDIYKTASLIGKTLVSKRDEDSDLDF